MDPGLRRDNERKTNFILPPGRHNDAAFSQAGTIR